MKAQKNTWGHTFFCVSARVVEQKRARIFLRALKDHHHCGIKNMPRSDISLLYIEYP